MFDNIATLRFQKGLHNEMVAVAMCSSEGEVMDYRNHITADGRVEDWMTNVLNEMRRSNRLITKEAIYFYCDKGHTRYAKHRTVQGRSQDFCLGSNLPLPFPPLFSTPSSSLHFPFPPFPSLASIPGGARAIRDLYVYFQCFCLCVFYIAV